MRRPDPSPRVRFPWIAALLLAAGCQEKAPTPAEGASLPPPASALADRPGPWANDAPPIASAAAVTMGSPSAPVREIAGAAHILVAYKGALGAPKTITRSKADAKKRAEEVRQLLRDNKAPFEKLVKDYSDDPLSVPTAGAIGNFERNVMPQAFSDATFNLTVGDISDVVESPRGFHIIRRTK